MTAAVLAPPAILLVALAFQALRPDLRMVIVIVGAALSLLAGTLTGLATTAEILAEIPWDVFVILLGLGLLTEVLAPTGVFARLAVWLAERSRGDPRRLLPWLALAMWAVSGLVNNLTALLLVLPIVLILFALSDVHQRYLAWTLGVVVVACNLGGAATPIGDFPAILLLGSGAIRFTEYLGLAAPATLFALVVVVGVIVAFVRPADGIATTSLSARLSLATMRALHRGIRVDRRRLAIASATLALMLAAWVGLPATSGIGPELVAWVGVSLLLLSQGRFGERLVRSRLDAEAALFLLSLFVMVGVVRRTGVFTALARALLELPVADELRLVAFLLVAGAATGLFSAGPSMAALLEVAEALAQTLPGSAVYVGLALSVCAGSCLFLTAATSGPLTQALTERAALRDAHGARLQFGFREHLAPGILAFVIIEAIAVVYAVGLAALR